jgi:poly(ADP-ribose) glycohydrolase
MCIPWESYNKLNSSFWSSSDTPTLTKVFNIEHIAKMEDHLDVVVADFANPYIGGGSLRKGCAQEEILFLIFPQLYISILLCERLDHNEALYLANFRQYSLYEGYQSTTKFVGNC